MQSAKVGCRRFIKNKNTGQYLRGDGSWTPNLADACEFTNPLEMLDCCHEHGLVRGIQVLLRPASARIGDVITDLF